MLVIAAMVARASWRRKFDDLALLAATVAFALLGNAAICGVISGPHDRYGARLVWIAPLVVTLLLCRLYARRGLPQSGEKRLTGSLAAELIPPA
jgi:hypothetical protein